MYPIQTESENKERRLIMYDDYYTADVEYENSYTNYECNYKAKVEVVNNRVVSIIFPSSTIEITDEFIGGNLTVWYDNLVNRGFRIGSTTLINGNKTYKLRLYDGR